MYDFSFEAFIYSKMTHFIRSVMRRNSALASFKCMATPLMIVLVS